MEDADRSTNLPMRLRSRAPADRTKGQSEVYVIWLFLLALVSRVAIVLFQAPTFLGPGVMFDQLGLRIAAGLGFGPTAIVPPFYPYYLGVLYRVYGYNHLAVVLSHALLGAMLTVVVAALIRTVGLGRRYAILGGVLFALFPQVMAQSRHLSPQILVMLFFALASFFWIRSRPLPSWNDIGLAGLMAGLCVLTRSGMALPCAILLLARGAFDGRGAWERAYVSKSSWFSGAMMLRRLSVVLMMSVIVTPWIVRNSQLHERAVWVDSSWALRVRAVTVPGEQSLEYQVPGRSVRAPDNVRITDNALAIGDVIGYYITEPGRMLRVWGLRLRTFLGFSGWNDSVTMGKFPYAGIGYRVAQALFYGALMTFVLAWLVLLRGRGARERALAWGVAGVLLLMLVAGGAGDARLAALPLLLPLAMRGAWGFLILGRIRLREPDETDHDARPEEELPVPDVSRGRWFFWGVLVAALWIHGVWMAL